MPTRLFACICSLLVLALLAFTCGDADAARFGGGRSFGGKPSMSTPFTKSTPSPAAPTMNQATKPGAPAAAAAAPAGRGMFGGMGGMLGGLLAGSLLGSMLFGGGFAGGGFLDIILIGLVLFLGFKFFARRKAQSVAQGASQNATPDGNATTFEAFGGGATKRSTPEAPTARKGGFDWDALTSTPASASSATEPVAVDPGTPKLPAGFDEEEFLRGAKAAYARLNASWDKRDLADIALFSTPEFLAEIKRDAETDKTPGTTEIMLVNASVVEVETVGNEQIVQVYFSVLLRDDPKQDAPAEIREVWHFARPLNGDGSWKLDGIQQVESM
ncbi:MAG: TIM44-like domain-containing protein [Bilophila sp.]